MLENLSIITAFSAGVLSFLSPCVVPLVPVYLASLCGPEVLEPKANRNRLSIFIHSLSFVGGFSIIFVALGTIAGLTGFAISPNVSLLNKIAGGLLIAFGLFILAVPKISWLNYEKRLPSSLGTTTGHLRSLLIGASFALAWTPCVGPLLGGILALALDSETAWRGAYLMTIYSLGLGIPFLIMGIAFDSIVKLVGRIYRYVNLIYIASGLLLIAIGIFILTNNLTWFSSFTR